MVRLMTADYVAYHAAERPDAVAIVHDGRAVSYAELCGDIRKVARAMCALGVRPGGSVAIGTDDLYMHWLLLLAFEQLGIAAASYLSSEGPICGPLLASVDVVLAAPGFPITGARRHHALTEPWIQGALALPHDGEALPSAKTPDDPVRIVRTSGATGANKRFLVTRRSSPNGNGDSRSPAGRATCRPCRSRCVPPTTSAVPACGRAGPS
jgi:non-ribosomal peptide synthetase component F